MLKSIVLLMALGGFVFGALSSSPHYDLNNYTLGAGGATDTTSPHYTSQASLGEQANGVASSNTKKGSSGSIGAEQLSTPQAPTLSNGSGMYYNKLLITLNDTAGTNAYSTDTTFAIAVSLTTNFSSPSYVQANGTLGASPVFQTYSTWGTSGFFMTNLSPNTTYYAEVSAKQGLYTNTDYGPYGSATTATPSTTFSVSPNSLSLGSLLPATITTSSAISFGFSTNAANGGAVYISGANAGLHSSLQNANIPAYSGNLTGTAQGFGVQGSNATQSSGGPFTITAAYNFTGSTVGSESTEPTAIFITNYPITSGTANAVVEAKASSATPAAGDYSETLTFIAAGDF